MNLPSKTFYSGFWACLLASCFFACTSSEFAGGGDKSANARAETGGKGKNGQPGANGKNAHSDGNDGNDAGDGNDTGHTDENDGGPDNGSKTDGEDDNGGPDGGSGHHDGNDDNGGTDGPNIDSDDGTSTDGEDAVGDDGSQTSKLTSDLTLNLIKENDKGECGDKKTRIIVEAYKDGEVIKKQVVGCPIKGRPITVPDMCRKTGKTCLKITFNYDNGKTVQDTWQNQTGCVYMDSLSESSFKIGWDYDGAGFLGSCRAYEDDVLEASCAKTKELQVQSCE
jgi:hypothetical protein